MMCFCHFVCRLISFQQAPLVAQVHLLHSINNTLSGLAKEISDTVSKCVGELSSLEPFPEYTPGEEAKYASELKPKYKKITNALDGLEKQLKRAEEASAELGFETTHILPDFIKLRQKVKDVLTVCCTNTAAKILTSKAANNMSGSLVQSLQATLDFASANQLSLPQGILDRLKACREKLAAAAASKQKAAEAK